MAETNQQQYGTLLRSIIQGNLSSVADAAYEILDMPIAVISSSLRVLRMCPEEPVGDELFDALLCEREVSTDTFRVFRKSGVFRIGSHADLISIDHWTGSNAHPCIVAGFGIRDELLGYVFVLNGLDGKTEVEQDFVKLLCEALSVVMLKSSQYNLTKSAERLHAMRILLAGTATTGEELEEINTVVNFPPNTGFILVMARPNLCSNNNLSVMRRMSKTICSNYPYVLSYVFGKQTYFLFGNITGYSGPGYDELMRVVSYLNINNISCGISSIFHDILDTVYMKRQAEIAYTVGKKHDPTNYSHRFSDDVVHCIAQELANSDDCRIFISDVFGMLARYDAEHNTQYLNTLLTYVRNHRDTSKTGEALKFHRTTMVYRLKKIEEICEIDLEDDSMYIHLLISLALLELRPDLMGAIQIRS